MLDKDLLHKLFLYSKYLDFEETIEIYDNWYDIDMIFDNDNDMIEHPQDYIINKIFIEDEENSNKSINDYFDKIISIKDKPNSNIIKQKGGGYIINKYPMNLFQKIAVYIKRFYSGYFE